MGDLNGMSTEDRVAVDRIFERLSGRTHYDVLKVAPDASWEVVEQSLRDLRRRCDPARFVGIPSDEYRYRIDTITRALDEAAEVLADPVRRFLYDQQTLRGEGRRGATPAPAPPVGITPIPPRGATTNPNLERVGRPPERESPSVRPPANDTPLVVPAPLKREPAVTEARGSYRPSGNRPSVAPPRNDPRTPDGPVPNRSAADEAQRRDLMALMVEVERIAVAVQFCIAQALDPQAERVPALQTAGQALADTRAALASIQARREEESGRWAEAAANWLRAARARPNDATIMARLAEAYSRAGDAQSADEAARRALALDPACESARTTLTAIGRR